MDSGMACLDGLTVGSDSSGTGFSSLLNRSSDPETVKQQKWLGASPTGLEKQERSAAVVGEDDFWMMRSSKVLKSDEYDFSSSTSASKAMLFQQQRNNNNYYYNNYNNNNNNTLLRSDGMPQHQMLNFSEACNRNAGYSYGSMSCGSSMNSGGLRGVRGPFTPSQWMELEHQALIYKYITANVPVPSNLLIPIEKAFESAGIFCAFSGGLLRPNTLGWGSSFHLGLSNSTDPEPGRCRRTDGKKWRCSRDAVADQKYCERHMNRGRHRSRKPVEGPPGHSVTGNNPTTTNMHKPTRSPSSAAAGVAPTTTTTPLPRQHQISYRPEQHSRTDFGIVSSESLLNPSRKSSELETESQQQQQQHSLRQFMDDWPKTDSSNRPTVSWPEPNDHDQMQSERTELSISIPLAAVPSDFMSSTSSPANDPKLALSPPRLCLREFYGGRIAPISWENNSSPSMGGPLGEVLHQKSNNNNNNNSSSLGSSSASPTGVLQRISAFGSVSNSSAGSSPGAENHQKTQEERASFSCNEDDYHHTHRHFHGSIV